MELCCASSFNSLVTGRQIHTDRTLSTQCEPAELRIIRLLNSRTPNSRSTEWFELHMYTSDHIISIHVPLPHEGSSSPLAQLRAELQALCKICNHENVGSEAVLSCNIVWRSLIRTHSPTFLPIFISCL
jgi:hypothetical protein